MSEKQQGAPSEPAGGAHTLLVVERASGRYRGHEGRRDLIVRTSGGPEFIFEGLRPRVAHRMALLSAAISGARVIDRAALAAAQGV